MVSDLETMNVTILESQSFPGDLTNGLRKLKEKDVRIILGNFNETWARKIFCEAYKQVIFYDLNTFVFEKIEKVF